MRDWAARVRERMAAEGLVPSAHAEAIQEIADHLGDLYRAALAAGLGDLDAEASVEGELLRMGPLATAVAQRDARRKPAASNDGGWISGLGTDFRHAMRALRMEPGFSAIVILTLAIGIGACTAVFSIVNALLLKSLPYPEPERLVVVWETERDNRAENFIVAKPVYEDWRREARSFSAMGVWEFRTFNIASEQEPQQVQGLRAVVESVHGARRASSPGESVHGRGRRARPRRRRDKRHGLADAVWRRSFSHRKDHPVEWRSLPADWRHAARIRVPEKGHRSMGANRLHEAGPATRRTFVLGCWTPVAECFVRKREGRRRASGPRAAAAI